MDLEDGGEVGGGRAVLVPVIRKAVHLEWKEARTVYESCIHSKQQGKDRGDNEGRGGSVARRKQGVSKDYWDNFIRKHRSSGFFIFAKYTLALGALPLTYQKFQH